MISSRNFRILVAAATSSDAFGLQQLVDVFPSDAVHPAFQRVLTNTSDPDDSAMARACYTDSAIKVLLTSNHKSEGMYLQEDLTVPGARHGFSVILSDPDNSARQIGRYTALSTFFRATLPYLCISYGTYTFGDDDALPPKDQISFSASCENLPFFTITGGQGRYAGASGYVQYMLPHEEGNVHEIHICEKHEREGTTTPNDGKTEADTNISDDAATEGDTDPSTGRRELTSTATRVVVVVLAALCMFGM